MLGNDDFLLSLIRDGAGPAAIADYVASTLSATKGIGVKCINAGAAMAFKHNVRSFTLDDVVPAYNVSSRTHRRSSAAGGHRSRHPASAASAHQ